MTLEQQIADLERQVVELPNGRQRCGLMKQLHTLRLEQTSRRRG